MKRSVINLQACHKASWSAYSLAVSDKMSQRAPSKAVVSNLDTFRSYWISKNVSSFCAKFQCSRKFILVYIKALCYNCIVFFIVVQIGFQTFIITKSVVLEPVLKPRYWKRHHLFIFNDTHLNAPPANIKAYLFFVPCTHPASSQRALQETYDHTSHKQLGDILISGNASIAIPIMRTLLLLPHSFQLCDDSHTLCLASLSPQRHTCHHWLRDSASHLYHQEWCQHQEETPMVPQQPFLCACASCDLEV